MALVWGAVCLLCAAGVALAAWDVQGPFAAAGDAAGGSLSPAQRPPDDALFKPGMVPTVPAAKPTPAPARATAVRPSSAERCLREREADALIDRLLQKIRKEKAERRRRREAAKRGAGR